MKEKIIACLLAAVLFCGVCLPCSAAAPESFLEAYSTDFEGGESLPEDFFTYFNVYDMKEENVKTEDGNTYYNGLFPQGSYLYSLYDVADYRLEFDIKTDIPGKPEENAYKSALALHVPSESVGLVIEADNGDSDLTSFLGSAGIFLYFFDDILEVAVHSDKDGGTAGPLNGEATTGIVEKAADRLFGVYSISYQFKLPAGMNFTEFTAITVQEENAAISVYAKEELICSIVMSEAKAITTVCNERYWSESLAGQELFSGDSYRKIEIKDAAGAVKATIDDAVVPVTGLFAFANRANHFCLDNLNVYEKTDAQTPAPLPSPDPEQKTTAPTASASAPSAADQSAADQPENGNDWLIYVLIGAIAAAGVVLIIFIIKHKNKK